YLRDAALADGLKPSQGGPPELPPMSHDTAASPGADETIPPSYVPQGREETPEARQFGRYRLVELLGQGAMGSVYLAEDPDLRRHVALKIPKFQDDQDAAARERFQREARAAATISHPNICQVYDIGEQDGTPFITMAYIQGKSLSQFVSAARQWPEREVAKLVRKIAIALAEAHAKGVVHRDLKPGNIMLDQRHEPIVMDFGLAGGIGQPGEETLTHTGMLLGTPAYMSPEQAEADFSRVGPASDLYSLGVICYELLTGQLPFQGPIAAVIVGIVRDEPRRPSELRPSLDKRLETICLKMMAKSPDDRYPTAAEVAAALRQFLEETATGSKSLAKSASQADRELDNRKREIVGLLQGGQFGPAADALEELAHATGAGSDPYAAWARRELPRVRALPANLLEKGPAIVETAIELIASQQYAEAVDLLQAVPADYCSTEAAKLLDKATKLQQEAEQLNARMQQAVRTQQYDGLQNDLSRLLELQPGNLVARELYDKLSTYAPGRPYRFDRDGKLLSAHRTPLLVLLGSTMRQALRGYAQRQKYRRDPAGQRAPAAEPAPARPALPILPIAIAAVAFALIVLAIVVLLRDGDQTVRVEIDDALLADESITLLIDGNRMEIAGLGETIKLSPGDHGYELRRGDELIRAQQFTVLKGDSPALEISLDEPAGERMVGAEPRTAKVRTTTTEMAPGGAPPPLAIAPFEEARARAHQESWADYLGGPVEKTNSVGMRLVLIPPGTFEMVTKEGEPSGAVVTITKPFYLGTCEVTVAQFREFVNTTDYRTDAERGEEGQVFDPRTKASPQTGPAGRPDVYWRNPGYRTGDDNPVARVSWADSYAFCQWLGEKEGQTYRLPTEAEWEYSCRAGTTTTWASGDEVSSLQGFANLCDASVQPNHFDWADQAVPWDDGYPFTAPVGSYRPNAFGLHDMNGNVWELCHDWFAPQTHRLVSASDPMGPATGSERSWRGGGWNTPPKMCRYVARTRHTPNWASNTAGFRVACSIDGPQSELEPGFVSLFNGKTLDGWEGATEHYVVEDGKLVSNFGDRPFQGPGGGHLFSTNQYDDFILRFEFKPASGGNSGVLIRASREGLPAHDGMEIQILDDSFPMWAERLKSRPWQFTGAISGVSAPSLGHEKPPGEWNQMEILCQDRRARVTLNGEAVLDVDLDEVAKAPSNGKPHPGLKREQGYIGLLGTSSQGRVEYRNIRIKELDPAEAKRLEKRGNELAQRAQWGPAAAEFAKAVNLDPSGHYNWLRLAALLLQTGDEAEYRRVCRDMLAEFGRTDNAWAAERTAKV
ncbi:MAG: SUMF1/EgtB/PvdO family nonheme iron enzyme, partial [Planctomycetes bacterium]|nr:SUMF1/EgtB/PvdO family nonheme iron enzyme [Planctomycetota bacterium]